MMNKVTEKQNRLMFINLDDYVPEDHLLRAIRKVVGFEFIYDKVRPLYSDVGRTSIDPVLLIKMLLLGYLYGIPSERKLEEEVRLNLAYRWFLGLDLEDKVPDHSTFSQNRRRRFKQSGIFQEVFDHIIAQCVRQGLVTGEVIVTDSTHIKASASLDRTEKAVVEKAPSAYIRELENEARRLEAEFQAKRDEAGKKKSGKKANPEGKKMIRSILRSTTDPEAGYMNRPGKPKGFHYLSHTSIDCEHGIITDIHVTPGNVPDQHPYIGRLQTQERKFGFKIKKAGADKGYDYAEVYFGLEKLAIEGYIPPYERATAFQAIKAKEFIYDEADDLYRCPAGKLLRPTHVRQESGAKVNKVYAARAKDCKNCAQRPECFGKTASARTIKRPIMQDVIERNRLKSKTPEYREVQRLRRIWCEGTFATLKQEHNLRTTYKRGLENVMEQCLLSAVALNLKRMIKAIA